MDGETYTEIGQNYDKVVAGIRIDWDVPIEMDDGVVLRCDVFRPDDDGHYPVIISYGPYCKWLHWKDGYPSQGTQMGEDFPDGR
ncbi:MAG: peptidase S15, partial [Alphaproteobacteria bacterium]